MPDLAKYLPRCAAPWIAIVVVAGIGLSAFLCLLPAVLHVVEAEQRSRCRQNLRQIATACVAYQDIHKVFPDPKMLRRQPHAPPVAIDLSWRVAILPFVEQDALFNRFDQHAGWEHAANKLLLPARPAAFSCPWRQPPEGTQTWFQYFTGPNTLFPPGTTGVKGKEIPDGASQVILCAEAAAAVPWTQPADMLLTPNDPPPLPTGLVTVGLADGSVRVIDRDRMSDTMLRWAIDPRDGNAVIWY